MPTVRRGSRLCVVRFVEVGGDYHPVPMREGEVVGHPDDDPTRVWIRWTTGDRAGTVELMRTEDAVRWAWR